MTIKKTDMDHAKGAFKNHRATYKLYGDDVAALDFRNKDGSIAYYIRYVFDGYNLYISGDLGTAVITLTEKATLSALANYINMPDYFTEKIRCSSDLYVYDYKKAHRVLEEKLLENICDEDYDDPEDAECLREERGDLISDLLGTLDSYNGWSVSSDMIDRVSEIDPDYFEWLYSAGREYSPRIACWLMGLYLAFHQLKKEGREK